MEDHLFKLVPINDILEESEIVRDVVVLVFNYRKNPPLYMVENKYCGLTPPQKINFNIHYLEIDPNQFNDNFIEFFKKRNDIFRHAYNRLVIYIGYDMMYESNIFAETTLIVNSLLKDYPIKICIFKCNEYFSDIPLDSYWTKNMFTNPNVVKIYNIVTRQQRKFRKHILENGAVVLFFKENKGKNHLLNCASWFMIFLSKLNKCGYGRLMQNSGTCYLNAFVNNIVLSKYLKRIVIQAMKKFISEHKESIKYIKLPLENVYTCPTASDDDFEKELYFIFRLVYNVTCKKIPKYKEKEDIFKEGSKDLFSGFNLTKKILTRSTEHLGFGGFNLYIMFNFLLFSHINFNIALKSRTKPVEICQLRPEKMTHVVRTSETQRFLDPSFFYDDKNVISSEHPKSYDVLIFLYKIQEEDNIHLRSTFVSLQEMGYEPECIAITIIYEYNQGHAINGFLCDGVPKIFNSNYNYIIDFNWLDIDNKEKFLEELQTHSKKRIVEYYFEYIIFVNKNKKPELEKEMCVEL